MLGNTCKFWARLALPLPKTNDQKPQKFAAMPNHIHGILKINSAITVGARRALPSNDFNAMVPIPAHDAVFCGRL
jgi:hypothetical protein